MLDIDDIEADVPNSHNKNEDIDMTQHVDQTVENLLSSSIVPVGAGLHSEHKDDIMQTDAKLLDTGPNDTLYESDEEAQISGSRLLDSKGQNSTEVELR